mmetsp:Transcript_13496/g.13280  ORF Transcript_13496/g.13280 Transcript_13496/m.13280 type:complete len:201 (+) Transcript_13496:69-671(+)
MMMFSTTQLLSVVFLTLATLDVTHGGGSSNNQLRGKVEEQAVSSLSLWWKHLRKLASGSILEDTRDPNDPDQILDIILEDVGLDEAEEDEDKKFCTDELAALWRDDTGVEHKMCAWVNDSTDDDMQVTKCGKFVPLWNDKSVKVQEKLSAEQFELDMKQKSIKGTYTTVADLCMISCGKVNIGPVDCWERSRGPRDDPEW